MFRRSKLLIAFLIGLLSILFIAGCVMQPIAPEGETSSVNEAVTEPVTEEVTSTPTQDPSQEACSLRWHLQDSPLVFRAQYLDIGSPIGCRYHLPRGLRQWQCLAVNLGVCERT